MTQSTEQLLRMALIVYSMIGAVIAGSMTGSVARSLTRKPSDGLYHWVLSPVVTSLDD